MTIDRIKNLTYEEAQGMAIETMSIKEHTCFFVDFGDSFGYSILVFKNGKHIHYANDYELHHSYIIKEGGREKLRQFYIDSMNRKLYTDDELMEEISSYDEYTKKEHFLRNYWIMRYDYISIFGIGEEARRKFEESKKKFPFYNPVSFCYVANEEIAETQKRQLAKLKEQYKKLKKNNETFREMIRYELNNHEACITCDYTDTLTSIGLTFEELSKEQQKIVKEELKKAIMSYC